MDKTSKIITSTAVGVLLIGTMLFYTGDKDLCSDGAIWEETNTFQKYYCSSEEKFLFCVKLSKSKRTCYIGRYEEIRSNIVNANGREYECEGKSLYSKCYAKNSEAYYGEL